MGCKIIVALAAVVFLGLNDAQAQQTSSVFAIQNSEASGALEPISGLKLQSDLVYPIGQRPRWRGVEPNGVEIDVIQRNAQGAERPDKRLFYLSESSGKPLFVFEYADGAACAFDIAGLPDRVLTPGDTASVKLVNSRLHSRQNFPKTAPEFANSVEEAINAPGWRDLVAGPPAELTPGNACGLGLFALGRWVGELSVTVETNGDLALSGRVDQLGSKDSIKQSYLFGPTRVENVSLPKEPRQLRAEQTNGGVLPDGVLPVMEASPLAAGTYVARSAAINMQTIDDIGFVIAFSDRYMKVLSTVEWTAPQNFGAASVDLGSQLLPGKNIIVFGVHNKAFAFGVGKWAFDFAVRVDGQTAWRGQALVQQPGVGLRFWKGLLVDKKPDGSLEVRSLTADEGERFEPEMQRINSNLVSNFAVERSSQALFAGAIIAAFSDGMSGGGGGGGGAGYDDTQQGIDRANQQYARDAAARAREQAAAAAQWERLRNPNSLGW